MHGIVHIRVDDRLIHGQVATRWVSHFNAGRIMVIDDHVAENDVEKMLLRSAAPEGCNTSILSVETACANILQDKYKDQRVLVLVKSPETVLDIYNRGVGIQQLNIGNMSKKDDRVQIKQSVSVNPLEINSIKMLIDKGVHVTARMVPDEPEIDIRHFIKELQG